MPDISAQQAFIAELAPAAIASQRKYGVPASVTIAQAIDESGWGQSLLATRDHNLFGIKGYGPAGGDDQPTHEYQGGHPVTEQATFRVYADIAESIDDHGSLLASSPYYRRPMADRKDPNAFAAALTGVYATDPHYGAKLIGLMRQYNLYRFDRVATAGAASPATRAPVPAPASSTPPARSSAARPAAAAGGVAGGASIPGLPRLATPPQAQTPGRARTPAAAARPAPGQGRTSSRPKGAPSPAAAPAPASTSAAAATFQAELTPAPASTTRTAHPAPGAPSPRHGLSAPAQTGRKPSGLPGTAPFTPSGAAPLTQPGQVPWVQPGQPPSADTGQRPLAQAGPAPSVQPGPAPSVPAGQPAANQAGRAPLPRVTLDSAVTVAADTPRARPAPNPQRPAPRITSRRPRPGSDRYRPQIPPHIHNAFVAMARIPLLRQEHLYRDVARNAGLRWELLAACDWMQCEAKPRFSPVHGEKLGTLTPRGKIYPTKSAALEQCADDLTELSWAVYQIDLTAPGSLSIGQLASVFAAFRWGALLKLHNTSPMEFPYSVAGLTLQHVNMRWPNIADPNTPDKPGKRFRKPFGAVPVVLSLKYPAAV